MCLCLSVKDCPRQADVTTPHEQHETKPIEQAAEKPKTQTNEYGDKSEPSSKPEQSDDKTTNETDEYGLEAEQKKTYSQAEMDAYANRLIRERLARLERNNPPPQPTQQQQQQANQQGFQYDENSNLDWQQQLEQFTMQVIDKRENMRAQQTQQAKERQRMAEFEGKFRQGMDKFNDYHEVVGDQCASLQCNWQGRPTHLRGAGRLPISQAY